MATVVSDDVFTRVSKPLSGLLLWFTMVFVVRDSVFNHELCFFFPINFPLVARQHKNREMESYSPLCLFHTLHFWVQPNLICTNFKRSIQPYMYESVWSVFKAWQRIMSNSFQYECGWYQLREWHGLHAYFSSNNFCFTRQLQLVRASKHQKRSLKSADPDPGSWQVGYSLQELQSLQISVNWVMPFFTGWRSGHVFCLPIALDAHYLCKSDQVKLFSKLGSRIGYHIWNICPRRFYRKAEGTHQKSALVPLLQRACSDLWQCTTSLLFTATEKEVSTPTPRQQDVGAESALEVCHFILHHFESPFFFPWEIPFLI